MIYNQFLYIMFLDVIDLADDNGNLINLYLYDNQYANRYLKDNSSYVLIGISGTYCHYDQFLCVASYTTDSS